MRHAALIVPNLCSLYSVIWMNSGHKLLPLFSRTVGTWHQPISWQQRHTMLRTNSAVYAFSVFCNLFWWLYKACVSTWGHKDFVGWHTELLVWAYAKNGIKSCYVADTLQGDLLPPSLSCPFYFVICRHVADMLHWAAFPPFLSCHFCSLQACADMLQWSAQVWCTTHTAVVVTSWWMLLNTVYSWPVMYTLNRASAKTRSWGSQGAKDTARQEHGWSSNLTTCTNQHHQKQKGIFQKDFSVQMVFVPWLFYHLSVSQQIRVQTCWLAQ